jgi:hypothetical protein
MKQFYFRLLKTIIISSVLFTTKNASSQNPTTIASSSNVNVVENFNSGHGSLVPAAFIPILMMSPFITLLLPVPS